MVYYSGHLFTGLGHFMGAIVCKNFHFFTLMLSKLLKVMTHLQVTLLYLTDLNVTQLYFSYAHFLLSIYGHCRADSFLFPT